MKGISEAVEEITYARRMNHIQRLNGTPKIRAYSVAEHCYHVGTMFITLCKLEGIGITKEEIEFVFKHDLLEVATGDVLFPAKHTSKNTEKHWNAIEKEVLAGLPGWMTPYTDASAETNMSDAAYEMFKACDLAELWFFCQEEVQLGNKSTNIYNVIKLCESHMAKSQFASIRNLVGGN
jgi:5'-deoxynucleotidase YfbR-like HD superfamily hydrolase